MNLEKAIEIATKVHANQTDKGGNPYIQHPLRVMNAVDTTEEKIVAVLHDSVEDSDLTLEDLTAEGFSDRIISAIGAISKRGCEKRKDYLQRVINNPIALKVKIADMTDNMDISRIPNPTEKDYERTRIYKKTRLKLQKCLQLVN
jgi:GTP diphosphokinase / guanosine-3',5'-bis(diphosphate) 3'-diphosphatase